MINSKGFILGWSNLLRSKRGLSALMLCELDFCIILSFLELCTNVFIYVCVFTKAQTVFLSEGGMTEQTDFTGWLLTWWIATSVAQPEAKSHSTANSHGVKPSAALSQLWNKHTKLSKVPHDRLVLSLSLSHSLSFTHSLSFPPLFRRLCNTILMLHSHAIRIIVNTSFLVGNGHIRPL